MSRLTANCLLLTAAFVWGFAFVAQRVGMDFIGPFSYNGIRYALGSLSLLPLIFYQARSEQGATPWREVWKPGLIAGTVLFCGASVQQIGLQYTTAGKAAFITCLYIVVVPLIGLLFKHRVNAATWAGCGLATVGLYFLCVKEGFSIAYGDLLELVGTFFWAGHILVIGYYSTRLDGLKLNCMQCLVCGGLSLAVALGTESITLAAVQAATLPILYGGIGSVGVAYTLQIFGQRHSPPAHAAIILSMETVFAALGGYWLLDERLGVREAWGCLLMLSGMLLTQLDSIRPARTKESAA